MVRGGQTRAGAAYLPLILVDQSLHRLVAGRPQIPTEFQHEDAGQYRRRRHVLS